MPDRFAQQERGLSSEGGGRGELEAANPKGKRGRYRSSVLLPPKIRLYFTGVSTALEEISKLALNSSV